MPRGFAPASSLRSAAPSGTRDATCAIRPMSRRCALNWPPVGGCPSRWRQPSIMSPCGQRMLSPVSNVKCCSVTVTPSALRCATSRPSTSSTTSGSRLGASRKVTARRAMSSVAATGSPRCRSNQPRSAPMPSPSSNGSVTCWCSARTSARGRFAYTVPLQRRQSPRRASSGWVKRPVTVKRSPHSAGGVASSRISCRSRPLRTTSWTSVSASGATWRCSSVQRSDPPRTTNSPWAKNQSEAALPLPAPAPLKSSPATKMRPPASRRTSSCAPSISSCSKRRSSDSSERGESAANTRGRRSAGRWFASSSSTSRSSNEGTQPLDRTSIRPMRTGTPSARLARCSIGSRHCWMWGRMPQWRVSQAISNRLHTVMTRPSNARATQRKVAQRNAPRSEAAPPTCPGAAVASEWVVAGGINDMETSVRQPRVGPFGDRQCARLHAAGETIGARR